IDEHGGPAQAAEVIKENARTVWSWYRGEKLPKPATAQKLIRLSKGALDFNRIYAPLLAKQAEIEAKAMMRK
ncbi:MAG: hypothetical protein ACRDC7_21900, partial [Aeromonas veronii]